MRCARGVFPLDKGVEDQACAGRASCNCAALPLFCTRVAGCLREEALCKMSAGASAHGAAAMLQARLMAPSASFQDRASLLRPVFQVAVALVQVALAQLNSRPQNFDC